MIMTSGHYPYKQVLKYEGLKIIGLAEKDEIDTMLNIVIDDILKSYPNTSKQKLKENLKKLKVYYVEQLPVFSGARGVSNGNIIFINRELYDLIKSNNLETLKKTNTYKTFFHEMLHFVQHSTISKRFYKGHDLIGLIEGVTEKETIELLNDKRSFVNDKLQINFQTEAIQYIRSISIMQQLEVLFGKEIVRSFSYNLDKELLELMEKELGDELTFSIIDQTRKYIKNSNKVIGFKILQDKLMHNYFEKKLNSISTLEEANLLLEKLRNLGNKRIKFFDSQDEYEKFYNKILTDLKNKFNNLNIEQNHYVKPVYYVNTTLEDKKNKIEKHSLTYLTQDLDDYLFESSPKKIKNSEELFKRFLNYNFKKHKIFGCNVDGNYLNIILDLDREICHCVMACDDEKGKTELLHQVKKIANELYTFELKLKNEMYNIIFDIKNKKLTINNREYEFIDDTLKFINTKKLYMMFKEAVEDNYNILNKFEKKFYPKYTIPSYDFYENNYNKKK